MGRDELRHLGGGDQRRETLRDQPMSLDDIRLGGPGLSADRQHLGHEQREDLSPATFPGTQILKNRPLREILPTSGEEAETANLECAILLKTGAPGTDGTRTVVR